MDGSSRPEAKALRGVFTLRVQCHDGYPYRERAGQDAGRWALLRSKLFESSVIQTMVGLEKDIVRLIPYNSDWERYFEDEKSRLQEVVGTFVLDIQHVGSTSIPGMVAKPIIDIAIAVQNFEEATICIQPIEQLGYNYRGENGIPHRHFFTKGNPRTHHIHMNEISSRDWLDQIAFRSYLIQHPGIAKEYAELKMKLAQSYPTDRQSYTESKAPFINHVLQLARSGADDLLEKHRCAE